MVAEPAEAHLCCNPSSPLSWGRKAVHLEALKPPVITSGEIGSFTATPIVHTVELLDWATGGPPPLVH
jgi:glycolate oxidase iron-sulfur subunit